MNEQTLYKETKERKLRGSYLLTGAEELTKQEALDRIIGMLDSSCAEMNLHRLKNPTARDLLDAAGQLPFFDEFHIVIVNEWSDGELMDGLNAEEKKNPGSIGRMFSLSDAIVLFVRRGDPKETAFMKLFSSKDRMIRFDELTADRAAKFCMREAAIYGSKLDDRTARQLIEMVGTDAYRLRNELSKACGFVGAGGAITKKTLETVVTASTEYNAFKMLDALLAGKKDDAMRMLGTVLQSGKESPMGIAGFLEGRLRLILIAREMLDRKRPHQEIVSRIGGSPYAAEAAIKNAKMLPAESLRKAVSAFAEVNALVKSGLCDETNALFKALYQSF